MRKLITLALIALPIVLSAQMDETLRGQVGVIIHADTVYMAEYFESARIETPLVLAVHDDLSTVDAELFDPLPSPGEQVTKGKFYNYNGSTVMAVQDHIRTHHAPETVPALFSFYRTETGDLDWIENEAIKLGYVRTYGGDKYEALQAHQSLSSWTPPATLGVLWKYYQEVQPDDCEGVKAWTASDHWTTYTAGDRRVDGGSLWEVKNVAFTYYAPSGINGNYGWTKIKDCE